MPPYLAQIHIPTDCEGILCYTPTNYWADPDTATRELSERIGDPAILEYWPAGRYTVHTVDLDNGATTESVVERDGAVIDEDTLAMLVHHGPTATPT